MSRSLTRVKAEAMATEFQVVFDAEDATYARQAGEAVLGELDRWEGLLSRYRPSSPVSRLNASPPGEPVRFDTDVLLCLALAEESSEATGGAFSVVWSGGKRCPLDIDYESGLVTRRDDATMLDLGGIGKGFALDRMADQLGEWAAGPALLVAGGSTVLAVAVPESHPGWRIGCGGASGASGYIALRTGSLSGSSLAVRGAHIADPRTGRVVEGNRRAWAWAPTAAESDGLSTALMVLDREERAAVFDRLGDGAGGLVWEEPDGADEAGVVAGGFPAWRRKD